MWITVSETKIIINSLNIISCNNWQCIPKLNFVLIEVDASYVIKNKFYSRDNGKPTFTPFLQSYLNVLEDRWKLALPVTYLVCKAIPSAQGISRCNPRPVVLYAIWFGEEFY